MLQYEWENPSTIMLSGGDEAATTQEEDQNRQTNILDHYNTQSFNDNSLISQPTSTALMFNNPATTTTCTTTTHQNNFSSFYDPCAYAAGGSPYSTTPHHPSLLSLDHIHSVTSAGNATPYFLIPKTEERSLDLFASRIGLNLGGRTYFSSAEDDFVNRLYRRSRSIEPGSSSNAPRCQAEGCNADLTHAKHYHRRHKVCEFHSKASTVIAAGLTQRFCQQCSRFHLLSEFDNGKRSCRKRLADHNRRRRKSNQLAKEENQKSQLENACNSSSENLTRSPPESGVHSSPSVKVAISPPRMSLDCFKQRSYQATTSSTSSSSMLFSSG